MSEEFERRANCPMCGAPCTIEGKDGSTRYYAPILFTSEEIECIKMSSLLALRVLDDYCDEHPGVANKRTDLINGIIAKCDAILKEFPE